jgi:apolipoprotein N-acyltransferase
LKNIRMKKNLLVALPFIGTAVMLTVIQAPIGLAPLAWVSFVPFIIACSPKTRPRRLFLFGYVISLCYWLGNLYWVAPVTIVGWLLFCLYTALLWPVLALCLRYCRMKKVPLFLAAAILIVGIERMQGFFLGGFFWRFLAHSQYRSVTLIQIADIFGAGGVSFLIAMVNGLLAELVVTVRQKKNLTLVQFAGTAIVCAAVVGAFAYGWWRIDQEQECVTEGPAAASLQSNVPQSVKRTFESGDDLFTSLMDQSKTAAKAGAELIVWPETMVQATLNPEVLTLLESSHSWNVFDNALREHAKDTAFVLVGAYGGSPKIEDNFNISMVQRFNSAFMYKRNGDKAKEVYNKIHLVPFGEVLPLRKSLSWFYEMLMKIKFIPYNFDYSLDYGSEYTIFEMAGAEGNQSQVYKFGVMICYEDTVPAIGRRFALDEQGGKRLDWLVNISNDGWFVRFEDEEVIPSAELAQHAAVCVFRAVENRLAILRSVNTGISCLIDSAGRIRNGFIAGDLPVDAKDRTGMAGWFVERIPIDNRATIFSKYGEWLDFCCETCVIILIIVLLSGRFFRTRKKLVYQGRPNGRQIHRKSNAKA